MVPRALLTSYAHFRQQTEKLGQCRWLRQVQKAVDEQNSTWTSWSDADTPPGTFCRPPCAQLRMLTTRILLKIIKFKMMREKWLPWTVERP